MTGEIRSLTGLRGFAACFVMLYHFTVRSPGSGPFEAGLHRGYIWVDLFFLLSGFVMALTYAHLFSQGGRWSAYWTFLTRRLARVYPLYILITLETAVVSLLRDHPPATHFFPMLAANVTMVQAWGLTPSFEGSAWSISTEWAAYLLFPFLIGGTLRSSPRQAVVVGVLAAAAIIALSVMPGSFALPDQGRMGPLDIFSSATPLPVARCVAGFTLGLLTFRVSRALPSLPRIGLAWRNAGSIILVLAIAWMMTLPQADAVLVVGLFPLIILSLASGDNVVARLLASPLPYWLGELSYSIYLIHSKFVRVIDWSGDILHRFTDDTQFLSTAISSLLVVAAAAATYYGVEKPLRNLLREWLSRVPLTPRTEAAPAVSGPADGLTKPLYRQ